MDPLTTFSLIFIVTLLLLISEIEHKVTVALLAAVISIYFGVSYHLFTIEEAFHMLDIETLLFIVSSLILFESLCETRFFEFLSTYIIKKFGVKGASVIYALLILATLFSAIAENTITMIIMTTMTLNFFRAHKINPCITLSVEGILSNIGGLFLPISSIPGLIISLKENISVGEFVTISTPLIMIILLMTILYYKIFYLKEQEGVKELRSEIDDPWKIIPNKSVLYKSLFIFVFFLIGVTFSDQLGFSPTYIALFFATVMFLFSGQNPVTILSKISWEVPFFVGGFSIFVGSLEKSGLLKLIGDKLEIFMTMDPLISSFILLLICGVFSSIIANVSVVLLLIPIVDEIHAITGINTHPMYWALIFGSNIGGGLTLFGSIPVLMAVSLAEREGYTITSGYYMKRVGPLVFLQLLISDIYLIVLQIMGIV
ncbi:MAG: hypothetical protein DRJ64_08800 [Thermoprotei archaeon]|nr:MAG: hypothetical protein DRJ64_08800 [Thermoprotei archaeon]